MKSTKRTTAMFGDVVHRTVWFVMCLTNTAYGFAVESSTANWWHPRYNEIAKLLSRVHLTVGFSGDITGDIAKVFMGL